MWNFVELGGWGSAAAGGTVEDHDGACPGVRGWSWLRGIGAVWVNEKSERAVELQCQASSLSNVLV